jgi:hypothetical protein
MRNFVNRSLPRFVAETASLQKGVIFKVHPNKDAYIFNERSHERLYLFRVRAEDGVIIFQFCAHRHASQHLRAILLQTGIDCPLFLRIMNVRSHQFAVMFNMRTDQRGLYFRKMRKNI